MSGYELHNDVTIEAVTTGPRFHFFGYYDKTPWSPDGRYLLAVESTFMDHRPGPDDEVTIGLIDLKPRKRHAPRNEFFPLYTTNAWNWQQGCMLQWLPGDGDKIIFNDRSLTPTFQAVTPIHDAESLLEPGMQPYETYPYPVYSVSPTRELAASLNFSRMFDIRAGYGYAGIPDPFADVLCPEEDGLHVFPLKGGESKLVLSVADAAKLGRPMPGMETGKHRFEHAQWNTDGTRIAFLHRWSTDPDENPLRARWLTRLMTVAPDGSDPHVVSDHGYFSHYDWRDPHTILGWAYREGIGNRYFLFDDQEDGDPSILGDGIFTVDGHCSYSPDRNWMLTDTYPDVTGFRTLMLYDLRNEKRIDIGRFHGPTPADGEIRCDLHPRWNRTGTQICIDSIHDNGSRQMYVLDVSRMVAGG